MFSLVNCLHFIHMKYITLNAGSFLIFVTFQNPHSSCFLTTEYSCSASDELCILKTPPSLLAHASLENAYTFTYMHPGSSLLMVHIDTCRPVISKRFIVMFTVRKKLIATQQYRSVKCQWPSSVPLYDWISKLNMKWSYVNVFMKEWLTIRRCLYMMF